MYVSLCEQGKADQETRGLMLYMNKHSAIPIQEAQQQGAFEFRTKLWPETMRNQREDSTSPDLEILVRLVIMPLRSGR